MKKRKKEKKDNFDQYQLQQITREINSKLTKMLQMSRMLECYFDANAVLKLLKNHQVIQQTKKNKTLKQKHHSPFRG